MVVPSTPSNPNCSFRYLITFYLGQAVPVLAQEFYVRGNHARRMKLEVQRMKLEVIQR